MLEFLKIASNYGIIDIFFGIGIPAFLWRIIWLNKTKNYPFLHISISNEFLVEISPNYKNLPSIFFSISNSGSSNFYIARAYFLPEQRRWYTLFFSTNTNLKIHPTSDRIADKNNAFELKFKGEDRNYFTEYEAIVRPGHHNRKHTWLALAEPVTENMIKTRNCGMLFIEYATKEFQGVHKIRV